MDHPVNKICDERYQNLKEVQEDHTKRIGTLEQDSATFKSEIKNLCVNIQDLVSTLKWGLALVVPTILGIIVKLILD